MAWMSRLPSLLGELKERWSLRLIEPFDHAGSCSWVAPATRASGDLAVLKLAMPHMEGRDEIPGLRFWKGSGTARLIDAGVESGAMLLERCLPGTALHSESETKQDKSSCPAATDVLLATDLHAGNILRSQREPWLAIDPKPFVGDRAYDPVQHLMNCEARLHADPIRLVCRVADLAEIDAERLRLWTFARAAADPRENWANESLDENGSGLGFVIFDFPARRQAFANYCDVVATGRCQPR